MRCTSRQLNIKEKGERKGRGEKITSASASKKKKKYVSYVLRFKQLNLEEKGERKVNRFLEAAC